MPGTVLVGFALCALASANHCSDAASTHIGGCPMTLGLPGMQVNPLLPSRRTTVFPLASLSTICADPAMLLGPADIARAILACVVSSLASDRLIALACRNPPKLAAATTRAMALNKKKICLCLHTLMVCSPSAMDRNQDSPIKSRSSELRCSSGYERIVMPLDLQSWSDGRNIMDTR